MAVEKTKKKTICDAHICIMLGLFKDTADDNNQLHAKTRKIFLQLLLLALINIFWANIHIFLLDVNEKKNV